MLSLDECACVYFIMENSDINNVRDSNWYELCDQKKNLFIASEQEWGEKSDGKKASSDTIEKVVVQHL